LHSYIEGIDVQIVQFPGNIVDSSKNIKSPLEEVHGMSVSDGRYLAFVLELGELIVG
jgi:hypothetical protein